MVLLPTMVPSARNQVQIYGVPWVPSTDSRLFVHAVRAKAAFGDFAGGMTCPHCQATTGLLEALFEYFRKASD